MSPLFFLNIYITYAIYLFFKSISSVVRIKWAIVASLALLILGLNATTLTVKLIKGTYLLYNHIAYAEATVTSVSDLPDSIFPEVGYEFKDANGVLHKGIGKFNASPFEDHVLKGDLVTIYYNINNPSKNYLENNKSIFPSIGIWITGFLFFLAIIFGAIWLIKYTLLYRRGQVITDTKTWSIPSRHWILWARNTVRVNYQFTLDGKSYSGFTLANGDKYIPDSVGIPVMYDPKNPSNSILLLKQIQQTSHQRNVGGGHGE